MSRIYAARGFAIVSAIFILVVLAVLGAAIVTVTSSQAIGSAQDVQGVRAYQSARAGIEWGLHRQLQSSSCVGGSGSPFTFGADASTLSAFTVTVVCTATPDPSGFGGPTVYSIVSTACNQPSSGACPNTSNPGAMYVERRLEVTL